MKLLRKTTRYYLMAFVAVSLLNILILFFTIRYFVYQRLEDRLLKEKRLIEHVLLSQDSLPDFLGFGEHELSIRRLQTDDDEARQSQFRTVSLYSDRAQEMLDYRELNAVVQVSGARYRIQIRRALVGTRELIYSLLVASGLTLSLLLLGLIKINRRFNRTLWSPFYASLHKLKQFELGRGRALSFSPMPIQEFHELNQELEALTQKMVRDYQGQKLFVENASHELQTPLAVIRSQLELILQSNKLQTEEMQWVATAMDAAGRLSQVNKSLILLSRIEHSLPGEVESVDMEALVAMHLRIFAPEIVHKGLIVIQKTLGPCVIDMNEALAETLTKNLIQNAVRHNTPPGRIEVIFAPEQLTIRNTGLPPKVPTEKLFERFYKDSASEHSLGLGLAIAKQIAIHYGFELDYQFEAPHWHAFRLQL